jgi:hypothetical protein
LSDPNPFSSAFALKELFLSMQFGSNVTFHFDHHNIRDFVNDIIESCERSVQNLFRFKGSEDGYILSVPIGRFVRLQEFRVSPSEIFLVHLDRADSSERFVFPVELNIGEVNFQLFSVCADRDGNWECFCRPTTERSWIVIEDNRIRKVIEQSVFDAVFGGIGSFSVAVLLLDVKVKVIKELFDPVVSDDVPMKFWERFEKVKGEISIQIFNEHSYEILKGLHHPKTLKFSEDVTFCEVCEKVARTLGFVSVSL